jgi:hypothetical protein
VIKHIESGKKKYDVFQESGLFTSTVQTMWKNRIKLLMLLEKMDHKQLWKLEWSDVDKCY